MKKKYTFVDLIKDVFTVFPTPLTADEIWEKAVELGLDKKMASKGKTPWATLGARLYVDVKEKGEKSTFVPVSKRPARFILRGLGTPPAKPAPVESGPEKQEESCFNERDLHPLLVKYLKENPHFRCHAKTIFHENSVKKTRGENKWLHPDLVGVYFPFGDFSEKTMELQRALNVNSIKLFSFEMKKHLDFANLRQSFFQAVSNSSWAHEGYLVCLAISGDAEFRNEIQRLSNAFGIGIIRLDAADLSSSEIICPARQNDGIDWDTLDRLAEDSPDFKRFVTDLLDDIGINKVKSRYDKVLTDDELDRYLKEKKIK